MGLIFFLVVTGFLCNQFSFNSGVVYDHVVKVKTISMEQSPVAVRLSRDYLEDVSRNVVGIENRDQVGFNEILNVAYSALFYQFPSSSFPVSLTDPARPFFPVEGGKMNVCSFVALLLASYSFPSFPISNSSITTARMVSVQSSPLYRSALLRSCRFALESRRRERGHLNRRVKKRVGVSEESQELCAS